VPASVESLVIVVLVLTPGYILDKLSQRSRPAAETSGLRLLLRLVAFGGIVHAALFSWTLSIIEYQHEGVLLDHRIQVAAWAFVVVLAVPAILGVGFGKLLNPDYKRIDDALYWFGFDYISRTRSAWEYVSAFKVGSYLRISLKGTGRLIGVTIGKSRSFLSDHYEHGDIYVESTYDLDEQGNFADHPKPTSYGAWIPREAIEYIELLEGVDDEEEPDSV
jgi:hypothetical protein